MESLILMVPRPFKIERIKHMSKLEEKITLFKNQNSNRSAEELLNLFDISSQDRHQQSNS